MTLQYLVNDNFIKQLHGRPPTTKFVIFYNQHNNHQLPRSPNVAKKLSDYVDKMLQVKVLS